MPKKREKIYMDYASTTPVCEEAKKEMKKVEGVFANPSSLYERGVEAKKILEGARKSVANILRASEKEIVFTSGGTEGNNMIIFGLYNFLLKENPNRAFHIITSTIEHVSVLEPIRELERRGVEVTFVKPNADGVIDPKEIKKALRPETFLVSIMYANNEVGAIEPIREIAKVVRGHNKVSQFKTFFHTDACQAPNYLDINTETLGVDFITLDSGKVYGSKGVGAIYKKRTAFLEPIIFGGGQEKGLRSGTENISLISGFAKALFVATKAREKENKRLEVLQKYFYALLAKKIPQAKINGSLINRLPNNINICIEGLDAELAVFQLDHLGIECSATSACMSLKDTSSSYVIDEVSGADCAKSSLRFSFGRYTKKSDIDHCLKSLGKVLLIQQI